MSARVLGADCEPDLWVPCTVFSFNGLVVGLRV